MSASVKRLFEQFQPENYDLQLSIDREAITFSGSVTIRGKKVGRPSQRLTFHQKDLKITSAKVVKHDKKGDMEVEIKRINQHASFDEVRLHAEGMIYPGKYTITMNFNGQITDSMNGIYPCYFKHQGQAKKLIGTQFESHHAREAFPCIDEPEAKSTFNLTLTTPAGETALSNTPVKTQKTIGNQLLTSFETTPKMSAYLLAFVFGEMHCVKAKAKNGVMVSSWATVAQPKAHLQYANDEAIKILEFFEDYFETPFPLPKLDQVALPDFESMAMENWGLITFREIGLLADPVNRSLSGEQLITLVIAHEISHQWFGNLVTMKWWDDLWLNESFASIMENIAPDALHPDWQQWEEFATSRSLSAAQRDVYKDVQPVAVDVKQPDDIHTLFDPAIVYAKGARLLGMLREYLGEDNFRAGLKQYFKKFAYANTTRDDLWQEFSAVSGQDIKQFMTPWLQQPGQPLIRIKQHGNDLVLAQQRFLLDGEDKVSLWPIPLLAEPPLEPGILAKRTASYRNTTDSILNSNGTGHFITYYENEKQRQKLQARIVDQSLSANGRINFFSDLLLLSQSGLVSLPEILDLVRQCSTEPRAAVWSMLVRAIGQAQLLTDGDEKAEEQLRHFRRNLARPWFEKLGWTDQSKDDPNTKHLRTTVLAMSIGGEDPEALKKALQMFKKADSVEKLPAEQRAMIAGAVVRFGPASAIAQLMKEHEASNNPDVQESIAIALCGTRDVKVGARVIDWALGKKGVVKPQDMGHWFAYLMRNRHTRELAWVWLTANWDRLMKAFGGGKYMEYFIWYSSGPLSTPAWQKRHKTFFAPKLSQTLLKRNIEIAFGEIEARVAWRQREEKALKAYLAKIN